MLSPAALICLAQAIYYEARGEPERGQHAVAHVVLNRTADPKYPDHICKVVHQPYQFSWTLEKSRKAPKGPAWKRAQDIAILSYMGLIKDPTNGALFFHSKQVKPYWAKKVTYNIKIGNHVFYSSIK